MAAITRMATPGDAAVRAVKAGIDVILDSPDSAAAAAAIVAAVKAGDIPRARVEQSARRILEAKARLGLHRTRTVNLDAVPLDGWRPQARCGRAHDQRALDHARQGRAQQRAAADREDRQRAVSVGARLSVGMAHCRAEPHGHPGAEGALAEYRSGRDFRSRHAVGARPGPRDGRQLRRHRRRRVRARIVWKRPPRSGARRSCGCCRIFRAERAAIAAVRRGVLRQSRTRRCSCPRFRRCC